MESSNGLIVWGEPLQADGRAERRAALHIFHWQLSGSTLPLKLVVHKG